MKLKMRGKIISLALVPITVLGIAVMVFSRGRITDVVVDGLENTLRATALSVRDMLMYSGEGSYEINDAGDLVKGDFNITQSEQIADDICEETGVAALEELAEGNLKVKVSQKIANRIDEIGTIGKSIQMLRDRMLSIVTDIKDQCVVMDDSADLLKQRTGETVESIGQVEKAVGDINKKLDVFQL